MKKLLILCLMLSLLLTSCDLSFITKWGKTPETEIGDEEGKEEVEEEKKEEEKEPELPHSEMVALSELINRDDVVKIVCDITYFWDSSTGEHYRLTDVDEFLDLFLDANADLQFITDIPEVYDLYDQQYELVKKAKYEIEDCILFYFSDCNKEVVACGNIYANGLIYLISANDVYVSVSPMNTDTADLIDFLRESNQ